MVRKVFLNLNQLYLFRGLINSKKRIEKRTYFDFKESIFLITKDSLNYVDCDLTFNYLKNGIQLNLLYDFQINNFLSKCKLVFLFN